MSSSRSASTGNPAYRLVALDLDGTLLDPAAQVSPASAAAVAACIARGVAVTLATGKLFVSIAPIVRRLGIGGPQIANNGAVIVEAEDASLLRVRPLAPAAA